METEKSVETTRNQFSIYSAPKASILRSQNTTSPMAAKPTRLSSSLERTGQWVFSQEVPTDITVQVGDASFPLHKFALVAKSGYIRRKVFDSDQSDLTRIDLSDLPGGVDAFEKAVRFCYSVNFEITVHNVAALRCAAEYLEMTEHYCDGNLVRRTEEFLGQAALRTPWAATAILRSCESLGPIGEAIGIVSWCVEIISTKACKDSSDFPSATSPPDRWRADLVTLSPPSILKILASMSSLAASPNSLSSLLSSYLSLSLPLHNPPSSPSSQSLRLSSLAAILDPLSSLSPLPLPLLSLLLRAAIALRSPPATKHAIEHRIAAALPEASVGDLLTVALDYDGRRIADLESVRRIVEGFVEREMREGKEVLCCSEAAQKAARTVDAFVGEIATDEELGVSKFAGIAGAMPKAARRLDDDLYRALDIYLKAHPELDEIEREKVCSVMDPLRLSYEARLHASQNKRLPLQVLLHALYYDQLKLRSATATDAATNESPASSFRSRAVADASLARENESLRSELMRMKHYVSNLESNKGKATKKLTSSPSTSSTTSFLSSVTKRLGKLNPFRHGAKDTSSVAVRVDGGDRVDLAKPRRRRFSIS